MAGRPAATGVPSPPPAVPTRDESRPRDPADPTGAGAPAGSPRAAGDAPHRASLVGSVTATVSRTLTRATAALRGTSPPEAVYEAPFPPTADALARVRNANYIRTTKYTFYSFLPLNLLGQFKRFYNIYFLLAALLTLTGDTGLTPTTQIVPLVLVLGVTALKDGFEDYLRWRSDREANNRGHVAIRNKASVDVLSQAIQPGDVLYVQRGEKIPADMMVLSSEYEDGSCYIETAELDGETNLKRRSALSETMHLNTLDTVANLQGVVQCEPPNENLNTFSGRLLLDTASIPPNPADPHAHASAPPPGGGPTTLVLSMNQFLPRGSVLRNTQFIYGAVIYTGQNTKIMRNLKAGKLKFSTLESKLNKLILGIFVYNLFLIVSSVSLEYSAWSSIKGTAAGYYISSTYATQYTGASHVGKTIISFFVLYTYVIPISLFVTMEIVRFLQAQWMMWDEQMTLKRVDKHGKETLDPMKANNSNLNEDLGCIEYIFSDKTGTLTQNLMTMSNWWVGNKDYHEMDKPGVLRDAIQTASGDDKEVLLKFLQGIALCHSVIPTTEDGSPEIIYESQSPDETALLIGVRQNGVTLLSRTKKAMTLDFLGENKTFELLNVLEFNSDRKRMSVIIRDPSSGVHLYTKGADSIINGLLNKSHPSNSPEKLKAADKALESYSVIGLRTLALATRAIPDAEYAQFKAEYDAAEATLENREENVSEISAKIETNLELLGCTAIEDELQDEVPETIEYLLRAGIKIWCLTGDKQETAINIGMSCRLLPPQLKTLILNEDTKERTETRMAELIKEIDAEAAKHAPGEGGKFSLVVNGPTLAFVFKHELNATFLEIGTKCHSVVCCRVTPLQKALVVKLVQDTKAVCLAIGDGANDVSMIQAANIGVGIKGKEGSQACRAADYAIGEFRFLRRLVSVHGRYAYLRFANLIYYSFYKNLTLITVQWLFGFSSRWSASLVYEETFLTLYNVLFTSLPPIMLALFERDVSEAKIAQYPELYNQVAKGIYWNWPTFGSWLLTALLHAIAIYFSLITVISDGVMNTDGRTTGFGVQSYVFSTVILLVVLMKFVTIVRWWTHFTWGSIVICIVLHILLMFVLEALRFLLEWDAPEIVNMLAPYYLAAILLPVLTVLGDWFICCARRMYWPSDADLISEEEFLERTGRQKLKRPASRIGMTHPEGGVLGDDAGTQPPSSIKPEMSQQASASRLP